MLIAVVLSIIVVFFGIKIGSVSIPFDTLIQALFSRGDKQLDTTIVTILWQVRLPRVVLAFLVGAALAVSGTVMQSLLGNPLASAYTLGVSSGGITWRCVDYCLRDHFAIVPEFYITSDRLYFWFSNCFYCFDDEPKDWISNYRIKQLF